MARIVGPDWVADRLQNPDFVIIDPRRPMKYLSGHLPGAVNVPMYKAFGADGRLLSPNALAEFLGASGFGDDRVPILYDSPEGQNAAMLAWILEYLGRTDVHIMDAFFESWKASDREVLYKPVETQPKRFTPKPNPAIRMVLDDLREPDGMSFVDFRAHEEFSGEKAIGGDTPGHIPGAVNLVWRDLGAPPNHLLKPPEDLRRMFTDAGVKPGAKIIAYCRSGPRAALGYLALRELGHDVRLFDGSWAEWSSAGLPAEK